MKTTSTALADFPFKLLFLYIFLLRFIKRAD